MMGKLAITKGNEASATQNFELGAKDKLFDDRETNSASDRNTAASGLSVRAKAVILMNLNILQQIVFMGLSKYSMMKLGVAPIDICLGRTGSFLIVTIPLMYYYDTSLTKNISRKDQVILYVQGLIGAVGYGTQTFCMVSVPVVIWTLIINCAPFYAAFLAYFILGERVNRFYFLSVLGTFGGIVIVTLNQENIVQEKEMASVVQYSVAFGIVLALIDSVSYGIIIVSNRFYKDVHWTVQMMTYSISGVAGFAVVAVILFLTDPNQKQYPSFVYYDREQWLYISAIAILATISNIFQTVAFQTTPSAFISMIGLINVVYGFVVDMVFFGLDFKVIQIVGAIIIIFFNIFAMMEKNNIASETKEA